MPETTMNSDHARQRAEQRFTQKVSAPDNRAALTLSEYEVQARATREKIARLKALRLAKESPMQAEQAVGYDNPNNDINKLCRTRHDK
jgi:hypothetical protein